MRVSPHGDAQRDEGRAVGLRALFVRGPLPERTAGGKLMGTAFSKGDGSSPNAFQPTTTSQADELCDELLVELVDHEEAHWQADPESGLVKVEAPGEGKMISIHVTGQAVVYVGKGGRLVVDNRGYR